MAAVAAVRRAGLGSAGGQPGIGGFKSPKIGAGAGKAQFQEVAGADDTRPGT